MRKIYAFLFALLAVCGLASAQVVFDFANNNLNLPLSTGDDNDAGNVTSITSGNVTIEFDNGTASTKSRVWNSGSAITLRVYNGSSFTVSSSSKIVNITFDATSSNFALAAYPEGLDGKVWEGAATRVTFTPSKSNQIRSITVYLEGGDTPTPKPTIDWTSSAESPLTVAQALEKGAQLEAGDDSGIDVYVKGFVTQIEEIGTINETTGQPYGNATYYIADAVAGSSDQLYVYRGKGLGGKDLAEGDLSVGDEVIVVGKIKNFVNSTDGSTTIEVNQGNKLYSLNGQTGGDTPGPGPDPQVEYTPQGEGTLTSPYNVDAIRSMDAQSTSEAVASEVWVKAAVFGYITSNTLSANTIRTTPAEGEEVTKSNIVLIDEAHNTVTAMPDLAYMCPVNLPTGDVRDALNLDDHSDLIGQTVWVCGDVVKYMGVPGLKNVKKYSLDGTTVQPGGDTPGPGPGPGPGTTTISDILAGGAVDAAETSGTVMAAYDRGFLIGDGTGFIYIYAQNSLAVGDVVTVSGAVSAYGGCLQFSSPTVTKTSTTTPSYGNPRDIDGAAFDALVAEPVVTYIKVKGSLTLSGNYKNLTIEGANAVGSLQASSAVMGNAATGNDVEVTGYFVYKSGSTTTYGNIIATKVEVIGGDVTPDLELPSIARAKAAATSDGVNAVFKASDLLVTYVNGKSVYVYDGTDGLLLFANNASSNEGIKTGDKITADVKGQIKLYNGLTEFAVNSYENLTVNSSNNTVTPQTATIADITNNFANYENELVTITELTPAAEAWANRNITFTDDSDNELVVRDNWNIATAVTFDTSKAYGVTGFVAIYANDAGSTVQLYPRSAEDFDGDTGTIVYPDPRETALDNPYSVAELRALNATSTSEALQEGAFLVGYIVGYINGSSLNENTAIFSAEPPVAAAATRADEPTVSASNFLLADDPSCKDIAAVVPINLANNTPARTDLNLKDNPSNLGRKVWLQGNVRKYMGVTGLHNVKHYSTDGVDFTGVQDLQAETQVGNIYTVAGQRVNAITKSGLYIIGSKKVLVK